MPAKLILMLCALCISFTEALAFCGFYVAKADKKLFNKTSEVIIARNGRKTVVTMANDFQGSVKNFAMVIPVPEVLKRDQITIADASLFNLMDTYSAPRIVEYQDQNPCLPAGGWAMEEIKMLMESVTISDRGTRRTREKKYQVTIEAKYKVAEYDILILSAKNSNGLEAWLTDNGYKIPQNAAEVLRPYIKSRMKFFVVKVDASKLKKTSYSKLRPLTIRYESDQFMLPIRLGMANANEAQDMLVYLLSKKGRVETVNYKTNKIPTDMNVPAFVREKFGQFYKDLFLKAWRENGKDDVWLEYAWNLSGQFSVKCDPCNGPPPQIVALMKAGADWLTPVNNSSGYAGNIFFTRLHVRYDRAHFPQDLIFVETPNQDRFQGRYVLHNPASPPFDCDQANPYLLKVKMRRRAEMTQLAMLTGWDGKDHQNYVSEYDKYINPDQPIIRDTENDKDAAPVSGLPRTPIMPWIMLSLVLVGLGWGLGRRMFAS